MTDAFSINLWESRGRNATVAVHLSWMARWSQMKIRYERMGSILSEVINPRAYQWQVPEYMRILSSLDPTEVSVTVDVVEEAIRKLNSNKAADRQGIAAEEFKLLPHRSIEILTELIQKIITERKLPDIMKRTNKIPIPKKDKDPRIQDNHHGITIAPILCKIIELICMKLGTNTTYQKMTYNLALP